MEESDWTRFREIRERALDRHYQQTLEQLRALCDPAAEGSNRDRCVDAFTLLRERDKEVAVLFDWSSRRTAAMQFTGMCLRGLITDAELAQFSQSLRDYVEDARS